VAITASVPAVEGDVGANQGGNVDVALTANVPRHRHVSANLEALAVAGITANAATANKEGRVLAVTIASVRHQQPDADANQEELAIVEQIASANDLFISFQRV